ncbi:MAG: helix-turn-helix domain-containing protein [Eubacterium sp.]|nr:helix-turn-helix domain-containing protein [Eubacterium sp.]
MNQNERKEIMIQLNEQGLFQLKGAISFVAKRFSCSPATIYRYLSEITS